MYIGTRYIDQGTAERTARAYHWRSIGNDVWEKSEGSSDMRIKLCMEMNPHTNDRRYYFRWS